MSSAFSDADFNDLESALAVVEREQRKLAEFQQKLAEAKTVVDSRNHVLTVTMDGQGELVELKFNTTAYRTMAPAELSALVTETIRAARDRSVETMQELMGEPIVPVDVKELTSGKADLADVLGKIVAPSVDMLRNFEKNLSDPDHVDDGWEKRR